MSDLQQNGNHTLGYLLAGAIVGASVALLYAPQSGRKTRRLIADKAQQGKDAIVEAGQDIADAGHDVLNLGRKLVSETSDLFERGRRLVRS